MTKGDAVAAIDIGTTKVCTLIGQLGSMGEIEVVGVGIVPSRGLSKGMVVDVEEATESIRVSVERAERSSGGKIISAHVGISGNHISSINNRGVVAITRHDRTVSREDVDRVLEAAKLVNIPNNRTLLHILPRNYTLDDQNGVKNPIGLHGFRLDVEAHIITGAVTSVQNITKCVEGTGVEVDALVLEPLASSESVLTREEKDMGVLLADIGGGTTDAAVFINGSIWHTSIIPIGGNHLTHDLVIGMRAPFGAAEEVKIAYGHVDPLAIDPDEEVDFQSFGSEGRRSIKRRMVSEVLRARIEELLEMLLVDVKRSGYGSMLPAGIVITGGTASLSGLAQAASEMLDMPVRVGFPREVCGLIDNISGPAYATSTGLLMWALRQDASAIKVSSGEGSLLKGFGKIVSWARELLPN